MGVLGLGCAIYLDQRPFCLMGISLEGDIMLMLARPVMNSSPVKRNELKGSGGWNMKWAVDLSRTLTLDNPRMRVLIIDDSFSSKKDHTRLFHTQDFPFHRLHLTWLDLIAGRAEHSSLPFWIEDPLLITYLTTGEEGVALEFTGLYYYCVAHGI